MVLDPELVTGLLDRARRLGATEADVLAVEGTTFSTRVRLGQIDRLEQARERRLGFRAIIDHRTAVSSTADLSRESLEQLVAQTCARAALMAPDPYSGLPASGLGVTSVADLDLWDASYGDPPAEEKIELARMAEASALGYDPRINNSEGAEFDQGQSEIVYADTNGVFGRYRSSSFSLSVVAIAGRGDSMQRDYWYSAKRKFRLLDPPEVIGKVAAQRALARLGARKVPTQEAPVVFDPQMTARLVSALVTAASGYALYKGASYLAGSLGQVIASPLVTIVDDGTIPMGLGSKPFDGEGLPTRRTELVDGGVLRSYLLDTYSAKKLGLSATGNAARGVGDPPSVSPTNCYLAAGSSSPHEIIGSVQRGLYVTELIGFGVNTVTGDYSQGASGLWIEHGEVKFPVEEITIAGNLKTIFRDIEMIGNDLEFRSRISAPTIKVASMTIAGT
jgi:PmbA protein